MLQVLQPQLAQQRVEDRREREAAAGGRWQIRADGGNPPAALTPREFAKLLLQLLAQEIFQRGFSRTRGSDDEDQLRLRIAEEVIQLRVGPPKVRMRDDLQGARRHRIRLGLLRGGLDNDLVG